MDKKEKKLPVDWDLVEKEIRAGVLTDRQIGDKHGRSHGAIQQYAKKHNIERNLGERIRQRTEIKLAKAILAKETSQIINKVSEQQAIEYAADIQTTIVIKQQGRIGRNLKVAAALIDELESQTIDRELYENLAELMVSPDKNGMDKLNDLYRKVISTPSRIDSHKKAVETEKMLIAMERQAFNIGDAPPTPEPTLLEQTDDGIFIVKTAFEKRLAKAA
jgi:hypothetical protein